MKEYILILDSIVGNGWFKILFQGVPYPSCHEPKKPPLDRETSVRTKYFSFCWILNLPCNNWFEFDVNQIVILSLSSSKYKKLKFFWVVILSSYSCSQRYRFQGRKKGVFFFSFFDFREKVGGKVVYNVYGYSFGIWDFRPLCLADYPIAVVFVVPFTLALLEMAVRIDKIYMASKECKIIYLFDLIRLIILEKGKDDGGV